jgi:hypothetical protein
MWRLGLTPGASALAGAGGSHRGGGGLQAVAPAELEHQRHLEAET